jgi:DNA-binding NarL/FixJ family response regulator
MKKLRILPADDHELVREGRRLLVEGQPGMQVMGEAANGRKVLIQVAWEHSDEEIAAELNLSSKPIETYKARVVGRPRSRSRTERVRHARRQRWLNESTPTQPLARTGPARHALGASPHQTNLPFRPQCVR